MVVLKFAAGLVAAWFRSIKKHLPRLQIDPRHAPSNEVCLPESAAQGSTDMAGFQAASRNLRQHGGKEQCVRLTNERDRDRRIAGELILQAFGCLHASKAPSEYQDLSYAMLRCRCRAGLRTK